MPLQYVIDMHCYQSISLVQDMVIVDVMKPQNNYIMYLIDIIITIIIYSQFMYKQYDIHNSQLHHILDYIY